MVEGFGAVAAEALDASPAAITQLVIRSLAGGGNHRGQIALALKQSGHVLDKKIWFGLWEWGSR